MTDPQTPEWDLTRVPTAELLEQLHEFSQAHAGVTDKGYQHPNSQHYAAHFYNLRWSIARELERRGLKDNILPLLTKALRDVVGLGVVALDPVLWLSKSVALSGGERWITVHPHGKDEPGVPVIIRDTGDGTGQIVGGAGRSLNFVKLTNLKSPEEYRKQAQEKAKAHREAEKQRLSEMTPEAKELERTAKAGVKDAVQAKRIQTINTIYQAMGAAPPSFSSLDDIVEKTGVDMASAKIARGREIRAHLAAAKAAVALTREAVLSDHETAAAAGLGDISLGKTQDKDLFGEERPAMDLLQPEKKAETSGIQSDFKRKAAAQGVTAENVKAEKKLVQERAHEKQDEERQAASHKMQTMMRKWNEQAKELEAQGLVKEGILKPEALPDPKQMLAILKADRELEQVEQRAKKQTKEIERGVKVAPFVIDTSEDVSVAVIREFRDEAGVRAVRALLGHVDASEGLTKYVQNGAFDTINNTALVASANELVGREVMEFLGSAGTAQVLAARLKRNLSPEEYASVSEAVQALHGKTNAELANAAIEKADEYLDAAKQIEIQTVDNPVDILQARTLNAQRLDLLEKARQIVGDTYGRVRAMGELSYAFQNAKKEPKEWTLDMGDREKGQAITMARSFGLVPETGDVQAAKPGTRDYVDLEQIPGAGGAADYRLDSASGHTVLTLYPSALNKLTKAFDPKDTQEFQAAQAIKRGDQDEDGWLPAGIESRPASTFDDPDYQPNRFDTTMSLHEGSTPAELKTQLEDYVGAKVGEGYDPDTLKGDLYSASWQTDQIPAHLQADYEQLRKKFWPQELLTEAERQLPPEERRLLAKERGQQAKVAALKQAAEFSAAYKRRHGMTDESLIELHSQQIPVKEQSEPVTEAVHRTLAQMPSAAAAFTPMGKLDNDGRASLRDYYVRQIAKVPESEKVHRDLSTRPAPQPAAKDSPAASPPEEDGGLFGDEEIDTSAGIKLDEATQQKLAAQGVSFADIQQENRERVEGQAKKEAKARGEKVAEPDESKTPESQAWNDFVTGMGGQQAAYETVQAIVKGQAAQHYAEHHGRVLGTPLKVGSERLPNWERFMLARLPKAQMEAALGERYAQAQSLMATLAQRSGGRFASEAAEGARRKAADELQELLKNSQLGLFASDELPSLDRPTIGRDAEAQLASIWPKVAQSFGRKQGSVKLVPDLSMSGDKVKQQRAVRLAVRNQRLGLHMGAGSGKSLVSIGAFTELQKAGKAKKAVYAVPSAVQAQFGSEMLRFTKPGAYTWLADPSASREERFKAYADDSTHMIVVTHQGFRDDLIHAIAQSQQREPAAVAEWFQGHSEKERRAITKQAMADLGWKIDMGVVDEAHNILNRQGKENSGMADLIDSFSYHMPNYFELTGTPVKNDPSEAFDFLHKMAPDKFTDRDGFMRKYGVDTSMNKAALQRLMARYTFTDKIASGVQRDVQVKTLSLTGRQQKEYDAVMQALNKVRSSRRTGKADIAAVRTISPTSFEGKPEAEWQGIANARAKAGLGGLLQHRLNSIVNSYDYADNAKIHQLRADLRADKGKPTVIFAHHYASIDQIKRLCKEEGLKFGLINGKQSAAEKAKARLGFMPDQQEGKPAYDVLVCTDAGSTGMNLQRGSVVVNYDCPDTAMTHEQRIARIDRIGQTQDIISRDYTTDTPVERNARKRLARKYALADIFQSPSELLDDGGLASEIQRVRAGKRDKQAQAA